MRILHITAQKPDSTGSGVYLAELVRGFARMGAEQAVVAGIAPGERPSFPQGVLFRPVVFQTEELPFPVVGMSDVMPYEATRYRDLTPLMVTQFKDAFNRAFDDVLETFQPDLVICHHLYLVCAVMAHRDWSCPIAAVSHSTDIRQMRQIPLERDYIRAGVARLDHVLSLHDAQANDIVEVYGIPRERITVVGTGYNAQVFSPGGARRRSDGTLRIAYVGKIWRKKGVSQLLNALNCLDRNWLSESDEYDHVEVHLVGGYSDKAEYDHIVAQSHSCSAEVVFEGKVSQDHLVSLYRSCDVFVLPSFYEGLPLVVIEALACGCTVVVTDLPGIRPWLQASLPGAPVLYVKPPRMVDVDTPYEGDLPEFEYDLAAALAQAAAMPHAAFDATAVSWDGLCARIRDVFA